MFRSAYRLWKGRYPHGGVRFIIFASTGITISLLAFGAGVTYITGIIRNSSPGGESYRPAGIGLCIAAVISLLSFLLSVRWFAHEGAESENDATAPP